MSDRIESASSHREEPQRYLIGKTEPSLSLSDVLKIMAPTEIVEVKGDPQNPDLLVVALAPERVSQLKQHLAEQYQDKVIIEPDTLLHPFEG